MVLRCEYSLVIELIVCSAFFFHYEVSYLQGRSRVRTIFQRFPSVVRTPLFDKRVAIEMIFPPIETSGLDFTRATGRRLRYKLLITHELSESE